MNEPIITTVDVRVDEQTFKYRDLVFRQHLRNLLGYYRPNLTNHEIYTALTDEAEKYNYEDMLADKLLKEKE